MIAPATPLQNLLNGAHCPPVVCRRLKPGDPQPFEWWDGVAGRWCRGDTVPAAILGKLPPAERDRYEAHRWRWLGLPSTGYVWCGICRNGTTPGRGRRRRPA